LLDSLLQESESGFRWGIFKKAQEIMDGENFSISKTALPQTTDTSLSIEFSESLTVFAASSAIILSILGCTGNLLTMVALTRDKKLRQQATTYFVISLAISDLFFCVINLPLTAARFIRKEWTLGPVLCRLFPFFFYGNVAASLMSMVAITINRYVLIAFHGYYRKIYSYRNIIFMLLAVWTFSFGMIFPPLVDIWGTLGLDEATFSCTIKSLNGKSPKKFLFLVAFLLPSISIILCYSAIFYKVRSSRQKLESHSTPVNVQANKRKEAIKSQRLEDLKLTKMMLTIFLLFMICFLPLMLVNVLDDDIKQPSVHIIASVLAWMSATINPIIYSFLNKQYQKAFRTLLCRFKTRPNTRRETKSSGLSCYSLATGLRTPETSSSTSILVSKSTGAVELKYFSQTDDFTIVKEDDLYTQKQLQCMGVIEC